MSNASTVGELKAVLREAQTAAAEAERKRDAAGGIADADQRIEAERLRTEAESRLQNGAGDLQDEVQQLKLEIAATIRVRQMCKT